MQQRKFAEAYVCSPGMSGAEAAEKAGYGSPKSRACELLQMPSVQAYIAKLQDERSKRVAVDADYVLMTIKDTVERCRQAEPVLDKDGKETGVYKFDATNTLKGLELLGKHLGLFKDKVEHTGKDGTPLQPPVFNIVGVSPNGSGDSE